jgi:hypothetical protein
VEAGAVLVGCNGVGHSVTFGAVEAVVCAHGQRGSHPAFSHGRTKDCPTPPRCLRMSRRAHA